MPTMENDMKVNQNYVAALRKAETESETVEDIAACMTVGRACGIDDATVARHRMLVSRHRDDPDPDDVVQLRQEVVLLADKLRDAEQKLEQARNSHAAALQRHAAAQRQLEEWGGKLAARDAHVRSDPVLAAVLTA